MSTKATDLGDWLALNLMLAAAACELATRELFHRMSTESLRVAMLVGLGVALNLLLLYGKQRAGRVLGGVISQASVLSAFVLAAYHIMGASLVAKLPPPLTATTLAILAGGCAVAALVAVVHLSGHWPRVRRVTVAICVLTYGVQPVVGAWVSPDLRWPPMTAVKTELSNPNSHRAVVFLLLDELGAGNVGPILEHLARDEMTVTSRTLTPVGDATAHVIPVMFSRVKFNEAKPCGLTVICSGSRALDFARITATRPDIDVVGFFMPYCSIQGLRSCVRVAMPFQATNPELWRCAVQRRLPGTSESTLRECDAQRPQAWDELVGRMEAAILDRPVWSQGGLMFAHVPLPHPPAMPGGESLAVHYEKNIERAARLVDAMVARARQAHLAQFTLVIFSDHPLRPSLWCGDRLYAKAGCAVDAATLDKAVPLIVVGDSPPDLVNLKGNEQIFDLVNMLR